MALTIQSNPVGPPRHEPAGLVLVDDNQAILDRVANMLQEDYRILGTASDEESALQLVELCSPDLVVLDIALGNSNGMDLAVKLRSHGYGGSIVFLTVHNDPDFVSAAFAAGARGYVIKSQIAADLRVAIENVLQGRMFVSSSNHLH